MLPATVTTSANATVTATGGQTAISRGTSGSMNINIVASTVTTGATFQIEGRTVDQVGTGPWIPFLAFAITASGTYSVPAAHDGKKWHTGPGLPTDVRVNCTSYTDGSYVVTSTAITAP